MKDLTYMVGQECLSHPKYLFCAICILVEHLVYDLFLVYAQLWVMSFAEKGFLTT